MKKIQLGPIPPTGPATASVAISRPSLDPTVEIHGFPLKPYLLCLISPLPYPTFLPSHTLREAVKRAAALAEAVRPWPSWWVLAMPVPLGAVGGAPRGRSSRPTDEEASNRGARVPLPLPPLPLLPQRLVIAASRARTPAVHRRA